MRDEIMPGSLEGGDRSLGVIDACQGRFTLEELSQWLEKDSIVLFTSSKFYQVRNLKIIFHDARMYDN